jgi:hypothetical protein
MLDQAIAYLRFLAVGYECKSGGGEAKFSVVEQAKVERD